MLWGFAGALAGMVLYAVASLAQGYAARRRSGPAVLHHPAYIGGLVCDGLAWLCSLVALAHLPLFAVQALLAGSLALTVLAAIPVLKLRPSRRELIAIGVTTLGLIAVSASAGPESGVAAPGWFPYAMWGVLTIVAMAAGLLYRRGGAVPLGTLSGVAYSVAALAARAAQLGEHSLSATLHDPMLWVVVVAGIMGVVLYGRALEGGVGPATAALWVVEVIVPGIVGVIVLGDPIRHGWLLPALLGISLCVAGCLVLSRSEAQG